MDEEVCPGLITLDTGQPPGKRRVATTRVPHSTAAPSRHAPATCRSWWPSWPLAPTTDGGELFFSRRHISTGECPHTADGGTAAEQASRPAHALRLTTDEQTACFEGAPHASLSPMACRTPPHATAGLAPTAPATAPGPASPSPAPPLSQDGSQSQGKQAGWQWQAAGPPSAGFVVLPPGSACCCPARHSSRTRRQTTSAPALLARALSHTAWFALAIPRWHSRHRRRRAALLSQL